MSRPINDILAVLENLLVEHRRMLKLVELQHEAMKIFHLEAMDKVLQQQEASRLRIAKLENQRKSLVVAIQRSMGLGSEPTLARLAELSPPHKPALERLRNDLREVAETIKAKSTVSGRVAVTLVGTLNTVVRCLAGAVKQAGVYTKYGSPKVAGRIGVMEAVG